jgi:predicted metal-dependent hydrolase
MVRYIWRLFKKKRVRRKRISAEYIKYKTEAYRIAIERIAEFNKIYNFKIGKITIRNQKTRWGSCSKRGNINFNYRIANIPQRLSDYVIVHELCHLGEFNHSKNFWSLVERTMPDYLERRKELMEISKARIG